VQSFAGRAIVQPAAEYLDLAEARRFDAPEAWLKGREIEQNACQRVPGLVFHRPKLCRAVYLAPRRHAVEVIYEYGPKFFPLKSDFAFFEHSA